MISEIKNRKLSLLTDYYELLMMQGYFDKYKNSDILDSYACFDVFYRNNPYGNGFSVFCGLNEIIDYIENLHFTNDEIDFLSKDKNFSTEFLEYLKNFKFTGNIYAFEEGSVINKKEPIIKVIAPIMEAQLIEGAILCIFNHETLIATKAYRVCEAAKPMNVMEFGLRRSHSIDASIYGAKASVIAGCIGTSNVLTSMMYGLTPLGTMAHSWIMSFDTELEAFETFAFKYLDMSILLVDTYDTLKSGVPNAIKVFKKMREKGIKSKKYGIRIDSGDLAYLSKESRKMLDENGFNDALICASNDLDEDLIQSLKLQNAKIDLYGVGTKLITGNPISSLGGVYKLSAIYDAKEKKYISKIKISENSEKVTNPGNKKVYRIYNDENKIIADLITFYDETIDTNNDLVLFDEKETWKQQIVIGGTYKVKEMLKEIFIDGKLVYDKKNISESKKHFQMELEGLYDNNKRLTNPKEIYVDLSKKLYDEKISLLKNNY